MKRIIHTSVRIVTLVDPVLNEPYGHAALRPGKTYKNPARREKKEDRAQRYGVRKALAKLRRANKGET